MEDGLAMVMDLGQDFTIVDGESRSQSENSSQKKLEDKNGSFI